MTIGEKIEQKFTRVKWTGRSTIHRSLAATVAVPGIEEELTIPQTVEAVYHSKMGFQLFDFLTEKFHQFNWQISAEEFNALFIQDVYRHLSGEGDTQVPTKIRNPNTGNVFHKLATLEDLVGGVRIWHNAALSFGFRFRIAALTNADGDVPVSARLKAVEAMQKAKEVLASFEIAEPTETQVKVAARVRII